MEEGSFAQSRAEEKAEAEGRGATVIDRCRSDVSFPKFL
jgi:hypothetical protein